MRTRPGDFLAWVLAVIFSVLLVVFAAFLISDWYRADFSRFEKAVSLEERMRIIANSRRSPVADAAFVVFVAAIPATFYYEIFPFSTRRFGVLRPWNKIQRTGRSDPIVGRVLSNCCCLLPFPN